MPDRQELIGQAGYSLLMTGARNAVKTCLGLDSTDTVTLLCDEKSLKIAAALLAALEEIQAQSLVYILERHSTRPAKKLPSSVVDALSKSTASIYTVQSQIDENTHRYELVASLVPKHNLKHAHMINITEDAMMQGLNADYKRIAKLNAVMIQKFQAASQVRVFSRTGSNVTVTLDPSEAWHPSAGVIEPGEWQNLPNGEILTCPASVDGIFLCDNLVPGLLPHDRFELGSKPLKIELEKGRLTQLSGGPEGLADQVGDLLTGGNNNDRVGMFAVGTNTELLMAIGDPLQDMFIPGGYFSFGRSRSATDAPAKWTSDAQYAFSARSTSLEIDGHVIIRDGRYDPIVLAEAGK